MPENISMRGKTVRQALVANEFGEGDAVDFQAAGDAGFGESALEQAENVVLASDEFDLGAFAAFGVSKDNALGTFANEGFLGALGNKVALDFGGEGFQRLACSC